MRILGIVVKRQQWLGEREVGGGKQVFVGSLVGGSNKARGFVKGHAERWGGYGQWRGRLHHCQH
jgi:hypothetical protein